MVKGPKLQAIEISEIQQHTFMTSRARSNANNNRYKNVEFRLGEIEHLPILDNSVDVIISNCVINPSPNKQQVFNEPFRVLKSGGR